MNVYVIDAGEQLCTIEDLGELGEIKDYEQVINIVYAETPAKAKRLFIDWHGSRQSFTHCYLEWADKMSIRCLAKDVPESQGVGDFEDDFWVTGTLTRYGAEWQARYEADMREYET